MSNLFTSGCKFIAGAMEYSQLPESDYPEVAFVGRSNVGKSSLINALTGMKCARVSKTPGRTQQINCFSLGNSFLLADLPGYGHAAVSKGMRKAWNELILNYLQYRRNLRRVFLLIDARHGFKESDKEVMELLDYLGVIYQIVFTKTDKASGLNKDEIQKQLSKHPSAFSEFILTSSENKSGIEELRQVIQNLTMFE